MRIDTNIWKFSGQFTFVITVISYDEDQIAFLKFRFTNQITAYKHTHVSEFN